MMSFAPLPFGIGSGAEPSAKNFYPGEHPFEVSMEREEQASRCRGFRAMLEPIVAELGVSMP